MASRSKKKTATMATAVTSATEASAAQSVEPPVVTAAPASVADRENTPVVATVAGANTPSVPPLPAQAPSSTTPDVPASVVATTTQGVDGRSTEDGSDTGGGLDVIQPSTFAVAPSADCPSTPERYVYLHRSLAISHGSPPFSSPPGTLGSPFDLTSVSPDTRYVALRSLVVTR